MSEPADPGAGACAICGKPQVAKVRPFCSKRCADVDLGRWLKGSYVIPGRGSDEGDRSEPNAPPVGEED
jgi:endogenous inhibitor of DNA gyrase (YacG/DUF329 family)